MRADLPAFRGPRITVMLSGGELQWFERYCIVRCRLWKKGVAEVTLLVVLLLLVADAVDDAVLVACSRKNMRTCVSVVS